MASKKNGGALRRVEREPIQSTPLWMELLEAAAPWVCVFVAVVTLLIAAAAFAADLAAGHL